jgi:RES domain-containing protein
MGIEKSRMMEAEERGWDELDGYVCPNCVEDEFLKHVIKENSCRIECDYCGHRTRAHSAAPVAVIMEPIASAVFYYYNSPLDAMMPYDSEEDDWLVSSTNTQDMLMSLPLDCDEQLFEDIAGAFVHDEWVETASGIWTGSHPHEEMGYLWDRFAHIVKHKYRYFFDHALETSIYQADQPANVLPTIGSLVKRHSMVEQLPFGTHLFRARQEEYDFNLESDQLGAPPSDKARAGRMNPAGISYLYLAFDQETALAEIQYNPSRHAAIGQFEVLRDLQFLNLTTLPNLPSIFDDNHRDELEGLLFLESFIEEITKPVQKNGSEHIEYVPSQVVSEYFALIFHTADGRHLDGILYPSAIHPGGRNLVLFPNERTYNRNFDQVEFVTAWINQGS